MDIVIIGSGNAAAVLGRVFKAAKHNIVQVYSRNAQAASALAYEWDTESTNYKSMVSRLGDVYIIAVNDDAIADVADDLFLPGKVVAHTAASVPAAALQKVTDHYGVFYPLQSLRKEDISLPAIPVFYDGNTEKARRILESLALSIAPEHTTQAGDDRRLKLHVAAVVVNNFANHLYALAEDYCKKEGLNFRELLPLIQETTDRLISTSPKDAQTGPALRQDTATISQHLALLEPYPRLRKVYEQLTASIQQG